MFNTLGNTFKCLVPPPLAFGHTNTQENRDSIITKFTKLPQQLTRKFSQSSLSDNKSPVKVKMSATAAEQGEEERLDMFEWLAKQRMEDVHKKRDAIVHEYVTKEPLKPDKVNNAPIKKPSKPSQDYRGNVKNMKEKWESLTKIMTSDNQINSPNSKTSLHRSVGEIHNELPTMATMPTRGRNLVNPPQNTLPFTKSNTAVHNKNDQIRQDIARDRQSQNHDGMMASKLSSQEMIIEQKPNQREREYNICDAVRDNTCEIKQSKDNNVQKKLDVEPKSSVTSVDKTVQVIMTSRDERKVDKEVQVDEQMLEEQNAPVAVLAAEMITQEDIDADADIQTSDSEIIPELKTEMNIRPTGEFQSRCTKHVITNLDFFVNAKAAAKMQHKMKMKVRNNNSKRKFLRHDKKQRQSKKGLLLTRPSTKLPFISSSAEGLVPILHPKHERVHLPKLPDPITRTESEHANSSSASFADDEDHHSEYAEVIIQPEKKDYQESAIDMNLSTMNNRNSTEQFSGFETYDISKTSPASSSIALELDGRRIRRAIGPSSSNDEDEIILKSLNSEFDETIIQEFNKVSKSLVIQKSKSQKNLSVEQLHAAAKSLSTTNLEIQSSRKSSSQREFNICCKCHKIVRPGDATFEFHSGHQFIWHKNCFACVACQSLLGHMDHLFYENEPYCLNDYVLVAHVPKCEKCQEHIFDRTYTSASGHFWHRDHFSCNKCQNPLVDTKFVMVDGHPFCFQCHAIDYIRVCKACKTNILSDERYVQSGDYFWHSNDSCLHCENCERSLVGRSLFFRKTGFLYCNRYCALGRPIE